MFADKIHVIKNTKGSMLSVNHVHQYVVGFPNATLTRRVLRYLPSNPSLGLQRHFFEDINLDVKRGLMAMDVPVTDMPNELIIDTAALLTIPKLHPVELYDDISSSDDDECYDLFTMDMMDFFMMPLEKNVGIIIPDETLEDSESHYIFRSYVVEPTNDVNNFRKSLRL